MWLLNDTCQEAPAVQEESGLETPKVLKASPKCCLQSPFLSGWRALDGHLQACALASLGGCEGGSESRSRGLLTMAPAMC